MPWHNVTKSHYQYVSDDGTTYRLKVADYIATQNNTGGASIIGATVAVGTEPKMASGGKLRRAIVRDLVGHRDRVVPILTPTAPMIAVPQPAGSSTLHLNVAGTGSDATFTYQGNFLTETRARRG
jgi:hypothetical protein